MAEFTYFPDTAFLVQLNKLADEENIEKVLKAGGAAMVPYLRSGVSEAVKSGTGALVKSIKVSGVKTDREGNKCVYVMPTGKDRNGVSNAAKLAFIEYGVRSKNRAPRPLIVKAMKDSQADVERNMQEKLEELI